MNKDVWIKPALKAKDYSQNHENGNRSPHRTKILNSEAVELLKNYFCPTKYEFLTEAKIPCARGKKFSIDILIKNKLNPREKHMVLLKAVESSFNKNSHNYANTQVGEVLRIFAGEEKYENCSAIFIDWVPKVVPVTKKRRGMRVVVGEETKVRNQDSEVKMLQSGLNSLGHKNCKIISGKIHYDKISSDGWEKIHKQLKKVTA